jgi:thiamine-monophosphate kinase
MLVSRYRIPQPRNAVAIAVRDHGSSSMDVSDGLAGDLTKLCAASGVSAAIDTPSIPKSDAAAGLLARGAVGIETLVSGGDDYEILCTVADASADAFVSEARRTGVAVSAIGTVIAGNDPPKFLDEQGREIRLSRLSYSHF